MLQQERAFREDQLKRQEENHRIQMEVLQNGNDKRFQELGKFIESLSTKSKASDRATYQHSERSESLLKEKKVKCPRWPKGEPLKNFLSNLEIWDKCHVSRGKYLELVEALQESQRSIERQRIELEIQNGLLDPCDERIIQKLLQKMKEWFGKTFMDSAYDCWSAFGI